LVSANQHYQTKVLISESTREIVGDEIILKSVDEVMIKGKKNSRMIYTINEKNS
jgi:hypothetical protein